jgi:hypothetical protein
MLKLVTYRFGIYGVGALTLVGRHDRSQMKVSARVRASASSAHAPRIKEKL